jgi:dihydropteroate synthase
MGIVNASPESFSDGALVGDTGAQVERALAMIADGAGIVDVGGESGVTGVAPLDPAVEISRVVPLVERLIAESAVVSVDTWKFDVARAAIDAGAHLINDVSGLRDERLADLCAEYGAGLVVMHTRARPKVKEFPRYGGDVVDDVRRFLAERVSVALERGVAPGAVVIDPGPDFSKTVAQTAEVVRRIDELTSLGCHVLLAVSRKDFVGALTGRSPRERDAGSLAAVASGLDGGATLVRCHDVRATHDFLTVRAALRGDEPIPADLALPTELRHEPREPGRG